MKLLYPLAKRFIAGYDFDSAKPTIKNLLKEGYQVSIDYVGEMSKTRQDVVSACYQYLTIIDYYKDIKIDISIKPTQLGLLFDHKLCNETLHEINSKAKLHNHTIRLDMEDSRVTNDTVELAIEHNIGCALQANHPHISSHIMDLINANCPVRLVKGAYNDKGNETNIDRVRELFMFYATFPNVTVATHDERILKFNEYYDDLEFLYGIRRDLQLQLKNKGKVVRIYVPFGENWLPYTLRRLKEWKNLKFVIGNILKELVSK